MIINIPEDILVRLKQEAIRLNKTIDERVLDILEASVAPEENFDKEYMKQGLEDIKVLLVKIPCIKSIASSSIDEPFWWLKFSIDIESKIAWAVIQELGHILNYLSVAEKLPTSFYPVSPPPYINGGPKEFLSWVIEPSIPFVDTNTIFNYLDSRLPEGYDNEDNWSIEE